MEKSIPRGEDDFFVWQAKLVDAVAKNLVLWNFNQAWFHDTVELLRAAYEAAYKDWRDKAKRNKSVTKAKDLAKIAYIIVLRIIVMHMKSEPGVTEKTLTDLEIAFGKSSGHPGPEPDTFPILKFDVSLIRHIKFIFFPSEGEHRGRPAHVQGMELVGGIFDEVPLHVSQLQRSWFSTNSPLVIEFDEADRGKIFYFCVRWESTAGKKGPWSEIMKIMVP
jgi:hypothetical protein